MFKEKVNARTDNGPWHKLAGLWPVELKIAYNNQYLLFLAVFSTL